MRIDDAVLLRFSMILCSWAWLIAVLTRLLRFWRGAPDRSKIWLAFADEYPEAMIVSYVSLCHTLMVIKPEALNTSSLFYILIIQQVHKTLTRPNTVYFYPTVPSSCVGFLGRSRRKTGPTNQRPNHGVLQMKYFFCTIHFNSGTRTRTRTRTWR